MDQLELQDQLALLVQAQPAQLVLMDPPGQLVLRDLQEQVQQVQPE